MWHVGFAGKRGGGDKCQLLQGVRGARAGPGEQGGLGTEHCQERCQASPSTRDLGTPRAERRGAGGAGGMCPRGNITVRALAQVRQEQTDPEGHPQLPVRGLHEPHRGVLYHRLQAAGTQGSQCRGPSPGPEPRQGWRAPGCRLAPLAPAGQCSPLSLCFLLQRHFCVFAVSFPGHEALLTIYSAILTQHLALQKVPVAVQRLQTQLVAAALGEPLPPWVGRAARGSPCVVCPVPGSRQQGVGSTCSESLASPRSPVYVPNAALGP